MSNKRKKDNNNILTFNNESPIYKYVNPNNNDKLSKMNGFDLQDLIILINDYYLELRDKLGLGQYITFGLELEFENANIDKIQEKLYDLCLDDILDEIWVIKRDATLHNGAEINSPILRDNTTSWKNLEKVCSVVSPYASIDKHSGGHIHIGTQTLGNKNNSWLNFLKLWSVYENIIFRFVYGEYLTARPSMERYAQPMAKTFWNIYKKLKDRNISLEDILDKINNDKYYAVNFQHVKNFNRITAKNTIEFRCPNGSLNPVIWQNNVNLFAKMLLYSKSVSFNDDIVEKRHQLNLDKYFGLQFYDEVNLQQALELCDMLYTNNFDKVYFLKQYLKSFEIREKEIDYPKACKLTKKRN